MAFDRPPLVDIIKRVRTDIKVETKIVTILRRAFVNAISKAIAGAAHMLHGHLTFLAKQILPTTAQDEFLQAHFDFWGISKKVATFAELNIEIGGTPASVIPINTIYNRPDGIQYSTEAEATIGADTPAVAQIETATAVADFSGSLAGKFFLLGATHYVLQKVNGVGVDPVISGRTLILVNHDTDDTVNTVAANNRASIDAVVGFGVTVLNADFTITFDIAGDEPDIQDGAQPTNFGFSVDTQGADLIEGVAIAVAIALTEGDAPNIDDGEAITLETPISGVDSIATVTSTKLEGEETESSDNALLRLLSRVQDPPDGGAANDYLIWSKQVPGVTRSWVFPNNPTIDAVGVTFVEDDEDDIIPGAAKITEVADHIEEHIDEATGQTVGRPVTADVNVFAPTDVPMDMTIRLKPNTTAVQNAVIQELENLILSDANPKGARKDVTSTYTGTILFSRMNEVISLATDEEDHELTTPAADFTVSNQSELVSLGAIVFQNLP